MARIESLPVGFLYTSGMGMTSGTVQERALHGSVDFTLPAKYGNRSAAAAFL
jgi:hypothetical protein